MPSALVQWSVDTHRCDGGTSERIPDTQRAHSTCTITDGEPSAVGRYRNVADRCAAGHRVLQPAVRRIPDSHCSGRIAGTEPGIVTSDRGGGHHAYMTVETVTDAAGHRVPDPSFARLLLVHRGFTGDQPRTVGRDRKCAYAVSMSGQLESQLSISRAPDSHHRVPVAGRGKAATGGLQRGSATENTGGVYPELRRKWQNTGGCTREAAGNLERPEELEGV